MTLVLDAIPRNITVFVNYFGDESSLPCISICQIQLKERTEKLENWRMKENMMDEKRKEKNELLRRQSSIWIDERDLEKKILEAIVDTTHL
ncbi:hypothetical protein CK203_083679 [Vitis vinifera]|uniref:Uncharacterized protein n=1 Tax=Vitis vinifera TaxID=29760 RepID=A0A438CYF8_VITVI|nr:hypothetical protein CK203_083679 [Vitis vinifera]